MSQLTTRLTFRAGFYTGCLAGRHSDRRRVWFSGQRQRQWGERERPEIETASSAYTTTGRYKTFIYKRKLFSLGDQKQQKQQNIRI